MMTCLYFLVAHQTAERGGCVVWRCVVGSVKSVLSLSLDHGIFSAAEPCAVWSETMYFLYFKRLFIRIGIAAAT